MIRETYNGVERVRVDLRPEVLAMAEAMEAKLRKNDHKTGWRDQPIEAHIQLLKIEMMEFDVALEFLGDEEAAKECVDISNFALIIRDKLLARVKAKAETSKTKVGQGHTGGYCAKCDTVWAAPGMCKCHAEQQATGYNPAWTHGE